MTRTLGEGLGAKEKSPIEFFEYSYGASMYSPVMFFAVGTGGAIGAMLRYGISQLPPLSSSSSLFPVATLIVNVFGAFIIGLIAGCFIIAGLDVFLESRVLWWFDDVFDVFARNRWAHR